MSRMGDPTEATAPTATRGHPLLGFALLAHGAAHLLGTQTAMEAERSGANVELLFGAVHVSGTAALYVIAVAWTVLAAGFAILSWLTLMGHFHWVDGTRRLAAGSLVLTVLALPETWIGVVVNASFLAAAWAAERRPDGRPSVPVAGAATN